MINSKQNRRWSMVFVAALVIATIGTARHPAHALSIVEENPLVAYLDSYGVEVDEDATVEISSMTKPDGEDTAVLVIREEDEFDGKVTVFVPIIEDEAGNVLVEDLQTSVNDYLLSQETAQPMMSGGTSKSSVSAVAYYNQKTDSYGAKYYQPYKITAMTSKTQKFWIHYATLGSPHNSSLVYQSTADEWYSIIVSSNTPIVNQVYSTTSTSPYYFRLAMAPAVYHRIYFKVKGVDVGYYDVTTS